MVNFSDMPLEVRKLIIAELDNASLRRFSLVNRGCRMASASDLFHTVKIPSSQAGLNMLEALATASWVTSVKTFHYETEELVDPMIQHWEYFTSCIYTAEEYARDQLDFRWDLRGKEYSYKAIYSHFWQLAEDQSALLKDRRDIKILAECLPHFIGLSSIRISLNGSKEDQMLWFANRLFLDTGHSSLIHLQAILRGVAEARQRDIIIKTLEIDGFHMNQMVHPRCFSNILDMSLIHVEKFKLMNGSGALKLITAVSLPHLQHIELVNYDLDSSDLRRIVQLHGGRASHRGKNDTAAERVADWKEISLTHSDFWRTFSECESFERLGNLLISFAS